MELFEALYTRRSIRKYQDKDISDDLIRKILGAAMMAPSAGDVRPWEFILVTDQEIKKRLKPVHPYVWMIDKAPLGILICGDITKEKFPGFWPQDCSAAMQNLLLAAHALGLGAVWTGVHPKEERVLRFNDIFNLPEHIIPFGMAVLGWPAKHSTSNDRFTDDCIHYNTWKGKNSQQP